ncbi:magnesium transporter [Verrucomicrobiaceae bacterium N1E253]|uniref:Magnesium transporter MgtE n=1 Tax=Oceaniferula marina TaxID=2748318 RepID=A0A851GSH7_9BACT|nr:magnesium transporter [Oceaniferula marina]NWK57194.1 magnesium transporter [Oceaniferula marina]
MPEDSIILDIEALEAAVESRNVEGFLKAAEELHYADLAAVFENLDDEERSFFTAHISIDRFPEILAELPDTLIEETLERFDAKAQQDILGQLLDDDRADILQDVSAEARQRYLALLQPEDMEATRSLMRYDEDTAGGRMTTQVARITSDMTVKQVLEVLRDDINSTESLARIYVVDDQGHLMGKVRLRHLTFSPWDTPITEIMQEVDITILATADQEEAAQMFSKYDMTVLPVVDEFNHLLGIITHDDVLEILEEESTEDIEKMSGIAGETSEETYLNTSIGTHFKRRFPWLFVLAVLAISSGYVMLRFEHVLSSIFLLALYLPMVVAAGGNTGGQAATMVIRAMSLGELEPGSTFKVILKELSLGLLLGLIMGASIAAITIFILPAFNPQLPEGISYTIFALAVSVSLAVQIAVSTLSGALLPIGARAIKLDPAVVAAPAITTLVDIFGMVIYFTAARTILGL